MCTRKPLATDVLHETILAEQGQRIGFWEGVAQKIDHRYVTRNNLSKIHDLALQVFDVGSKTCNAQIAQKIVRASMLHGIYF